MSPLTKTNSWRQLRAHQTEIAQKSLRERFAEDPRRFDCFSLEACGLLLDYSKNLITEETLRLLFSLAHERQLEQWRERLFAAKKINFTENRAVLHWALRASRKVEFEGRDVTIGIARVREHMRRFSDAIRSGTRPGFTGKPFRTVVNLGIGGSDLGPLMVTEALKPYGSAALDCRFVSNIDGAHLISALQDAEPETTLFIVVSKTFTTQETIENAKSARDWFMAKGGNEAAMAQHFVAVTANMTEAAKFGIASPNVFEFWDWVGGRYSLWSAVGLAIALAVGMDNFNELLSGACEMDEHFESTPLESNLPVILALLNIWYTNFWAAQSRAVLPYDQTLSRFPAYLQQLEMESNGKRATRSGQIVDYATAPIVWGEPGTNGQHAFFQLLHQGTAPVPVDFIAAVQCRDHLTRHHTLLLANCLAQSEALMLGKNESEARDELSAKNLAGKTLEELLPHKLFPGNRPSNTILLQRLDPKTLGGLIALYEHKVFVEGALLDINSFDQWGVELGKQLAHRIVADLEGETGTHDSSTLGLIRFVKANLPGDKK
ncbi:MAG: glucose-6-phosphate isomerase [Burkholderiales bacterium]